MRPVDLRGCQLRRLSRCFLEDGTIRIVESYREHPRLARVRVKRGTFDASISWWVDDRPQPDLTTALRRLAGIPVQMELPL